MPAINSLTRPRLVEAKFGYGGETVTIRYDRNRMTTGLLSEVQESDDPAAFARMFALVIRDWDVTDDDGSPFPPTEANLARLPLDALRAVSEAIRDNPGSDEGKDSFAPSNTLPGAYTVPITTSPNGPVLSSLPESSTLPSPT